LQEFYDNFYLAWFGTIKNKLKKRKLKCKALIEAVS